MRALRIASMVFGTLLALVAVGLLAAGATLAVAAAVERDDGGYFDVTLDRLETETPALVSDELTLDAESESPWLFDVVDVDVRIDVRPADGADELFVGIARSADVDDYLAGVASTEVVELDERVARTVTRAGTESVAAPTGIGIWVVSSSGAGEQVIEWEALAGDWTIVLMNADGRPGVSADVTVGLRSGLVVPLAVGLLAGGVLLLVGAVVLIAVGARHLSSNGTVDEPVGRGELPPPARRLAERPTDLNRGEAEAATASTAAYPVRYSARLDDGLSRWKWLVKWILAIPHVIVLVVLWIAFVVLTFVAWWAIVFTRRYPRAIFDINVGIMRWSLRVSHYASTGGLGTDAYPSFGLAPHADEAVRLEIEPPGELSRWLPFVKLVLALPHLLIVGLLAGGTSGWFDETGLDIVFGGGLLGVLVLVAGLILLFTGRYPAGLYDVIAGLNRWIVRVVAYVALMTDSYPPFRLDQGPEEPGRVLPSPPPRGPSVHGADERAVETDREPVPT